MEKPVNNITINVLKLLPAIKEHIEPKELIDSISIDQYLGKADEINQLQLANSEELSQDITQILNIDDSNYKGIGFACIASIHTYNGNYKKAWTGFKNALNLSVCNDVNSYILTEYANLLRKLLRTDEAITVFDKALELTDNERLKWRIITCQGYCYKQKDKSLALNLLNKTAKYYLENNSYIRYVTILRHIGGIHTSSKDYKLAKNILSKAKRIADNKSFISIIYDIRNDLGWIYIKEKNYDRARGIYLELLTKDLSPYMISLVSQNLGYIEFECENYNKSIKYYKKSLKLTSKYEMIDMLFEDYYKIGISYERIGAYEQAGKYYDSGYNLLIEERNNLGITILTGCRKELEENFLRFLSEKPLVPHVCQHEETFKFAVGKTYKEILEIFQKSLLVLHRNRNETIEDLCNTLGISLRLYFVYQNRFSLSKNKNQDILIFGQHFKNYLFSLLSMDWRSAKLQFDQDLFRFLLQKHQHNKTKIASILDVSILTVIKKTANLNKND